MALLEAHGHLLEQLSFLVGYPVELSFWPGQGQGGDDAAVNEQRLHFRLPVSLCRSEHSSLTMPAAAAGDRLCAKLTTAFIRYCALITGAWKDPARIAAGLIREDRFIWDNLVLSTVYGGRRRYLALDMLAAARDSLLYQHEQSATAIGIFIADDWAALRPEVESLRCNVLEPLGKFHLRELLRTAKLPHLLTDGTQSFFVVSLGGEMQAWVSFQDALSNAGGAAQEGWEMVPREFCHLKQIMKGGRTCFVTTPQNEVYFLEAEYVFKWTKSSWHRVSGAPLSSFLAAYLPLQAAKRVAALTLLLAERRIGALLVITNHARDVLARASTPIDELFGRKPLFGILDVSLDTLARLSAVDGAIIVDTSGQVVTAGAILELPENHTRAGEGARSAAASFSSMSGAAVVVSNDGPITVYEGGRVYRRFG